MRSRSPRAGFEALAYAGLRDEHRLIRDHLARLEAAADGDELSDLVGLVHDLACRLDLHRRREDEVMLPALALHLGEDSGPVRLVRQGHVDEVRLLGELRAATGRAALRRAVAGLSTLLRAHMDIEEEALFPMVEIVLDASEREQLARRMVELGEEAACRTGR
ncbi:MAG: hemerythrin domain-containing protein [Planctomycetes bacterium]|nr:hemerythrin domain-containing protein [Planctomycetota bacterium]